VCGEGEKGGTKVQNIKQGKKRCVHPPGVVCVLSQALCLLGFMLASFSLLLCPCAFIPSSPPSLPPFYLGAFFLLSMYAYCVCDPSFSLLCVAFLPPVMCEIPSYGRCPRMQSRGASQRGHRRLAYIVVQTTHTHLLLPLLI
jgi:hypothetical protein